MWPLGTNILFCFFCVALFVFLEAFLDLMATAPDFAAIYCNSLMSPSTMHGKMTTLDKNFEPIDNFWKQIVKHICQNDT